MFLVTGLIQLSIFGNHSNNLNQQYVFDALNVEKIELGAEVVDLFNLDFLFFISSYSLIELAYFLFNHNNIISHYTLVLTYKHYLFLPQIGPPHFLS